MPQDTRERYASIPRKEIAGLRDILIHGYASVNYRIVWDIVKNEVPKLKSNAEKMMRDAGDEKP